MADEEKVEISKAQFDVFQRAIAVLEGAWKDKDAGMPLKRFAKKFNPNSNIPELDIAEPMLAPVKSELEEARKSIKTLVDRIDAKEKAEKDSKEESDMRSSLSAAQKEYGLGDEMMEKVKARMKETNNPDPAAAAAWLTDHEPKARPTSRSSFTPGDLNLFGAGTKSEDEDIAALHKDPIRWADQKAGSMLDAWARGENIDSDAA